MVLVFSIAVDASRENVRVRAAPSQQTFFTNHASISSTCFNSISSHYDFVVKAIRLTGSRDTSRIAVRQIPWCRLRGREQVLVQLTGDDYQRISSRAMSFSFVPAA